MARVLIVGCGCRGQALARRLRQDGHLVRGTTRECKNRAVVDAAGAESALADPNRLETLLPAIDGIAVIAWLLGSATGNEDEVAGLHGERLETLLRKVVDTPVRGFVYEAVGTLPEGTLRQGREVVGVAAETWSLPVETVESDPLDYEGWLTEAYAAVSRLIQPFI